MGVCCVGMRAADDEDSQADQGNTGPAEQRNHLAKKQVTQDRDRSVGQRGGGLDVTVVRPGE